MRKQPLLLLATALVGLLFFIATDPAWGFGSRFDGAANTNVVDASRIARPGTIAGVAGCGVIAAMAAGLSLKRIG
jgi:hypothetical protein